MDTCKLYFSNKHTRRGSEVMFIENNKISLINEEVAKELNQYLGNITDSLVLHEFPYEKVCEELDDIKNSLWT